MRYSAAQAQRFFDQVAERARQVPGVKSAALASSVPMNGFSAITIVPDGFQFPAGAKSTTLAGSMVDEHYIEAIGLAILIGRGFRVTDSAGAPRVAVVNEQLARSYWPGQDPLGKVAYAASRRTREIGIRMAIGAERSTVLWMVLR